MAPLTKARMTPERTGDTFVGLIAAGATIHAGALLMRNAAGFVLPATAAAGLVGIGRAHGDVDNAVGADGDVTVEYRPGCFHYANAVGDEVTSADIGARCYAHDDQTVGRSDGGGARSPAGYIADLDANGVWVRLDEHLLAAAAA